MTSQQQKQKRGGRAGSFSKGARGDADHADALTHLGYPARARPQGSGLGRLQAREARRLMKAYACSHEEAIDLMRAAGSLPDAPSDIKCALLEPVAHLESKFYSEAQWTRRTVMAAWRTQVHGDAKAHQLPVVLHSWDYCREPLVLVFPREAGRGWHMYTLSEWIYTLEHTGYTLRDPTGNPVIDPATGRPRGARLKPAAGAGTASKQRAMLSVHPVDRLNAAKWAHDEGGDYAAGVAAAARRRQEQAQWHHSPEGMRAWLDHLVKADALDSAMLDDLDQLAVHGGLYNVGALRPAFYRTPAGLELELIPEKYAVRHGRAPEGSRDYAHARPVWVQGDHIYDRSDLILVRNDEGAPQRHETGQLVWELVPDAQPVAVTSMLEWHAQYWGSDGKAK